MWPKGESSDKKLLGVLLCVLYKYINKHWGLGRGVEQITKIQGSPRVCGLRMQFGPYKLHGKQAYWLILASIGPIGAHTSAQIFLPAWVAAISFGT